MAANELVIPETELTPDVLESLTVSICMGVPKYPGLDEASELCQTANEMLVDSEPSKSAAALLGQKIAAHKRQALAHYKPFKQVIDRLHGKICDLEKATINGMDAAYSRLGSGIMNFDRVMRERQAAEAKKAEEEARQKRLEEQRAIEEERQAEAERLAAEGKQEAAHAVLEEAVREVEELKAEPLQVVLPPTAPIEKPKGSVARKTWRFEVVDKQALILAAAKNPEAFARMLTADEKVIGALLRAQGDDFNVPGVRIWAEESLGFRTAK